MTDVIERMPEQAALRAFAETVHGHIILPGDEEYESARRVWNGMINRYPAAILRCAGVADVIAGVKYAREHGLTVAVRGGGHNVAGNAVCDGGMVIDLSVMRSVRVDPARRVARADPGCTWLDFDHETQAFGLATTGGLVSSTGVAGFTLGGGIGWLTRKHGFACDNLRSVDVVTADGELLAASTQEHADLFWGVRGGGGNFGVVTSFEFDLHPVGPMVLGGGVFHSLEQGDELLRAYRDWVAEAPDELTTLAVIMTAPPAPFIPESLQGRPALALLACYVGPAEEGEKVLAPLHHLGTPAADVLGPIPYTVLQTMFDHGAPPGMDNYWKSHYLGTLDDAVIDAIVSAASTLPVPFTAIHLHQLGGAAARQPEGGTAFGHRDAGYALNFVGTWTDPAETDRQIRWVRESWSATEPFSTGVYVNFLGDEGQEMVRAAYDQDAYQRLVALKRRYDPNNVFHLNQNIKP